MKTQITAYQTGRQIIAFSNHFREVHWGQKVGLFPSRGLRGKPWGHAVSYTQAVISVLYLV